MIPAGLYKFRHQIVRDLAWVIFSPVLLDIPPNGIFRFADNSFLTSGSSNVKRFLEELDENPQRLTGFIANQNSRLIGKYFENLVKFWLLFGIHSYELIASNLQVNSRGRTIGEFDFILRDNTNGKFIHLEVAGKFFMAYRNTGKWSDFIGPNGIDNLEVKLKRLQNGQMLLTQKPESIELLNKLGITGNLTKIILLKGYAFYHARNYFTNNFIAVRNAAENHLKGWWIRFSEAESFFANRKARWVIIERKNWVSRVYNPPAANVLDSYGLTQKLKKYFSSNFYPLLVAQLESSSGILCETSRGFIVSNNWPKD